MPIWIATAFSAARGIAAKIPWQTYVAAGLLAAIPINGCVQYRSGYSDGRESVLAELRTAEAEAAEKAQKAIESAGKAGAERAEVFEAKQEALNEAIREAEAAGDNPLDALF